MVIKNPIMSLINVSNTNFILKDRKNYNYVLNLLRFLN
jgi:hypothetical protein